MSKDRFDELVEERQQLRDRLTEVESALREEAMNFGKSAIRPAAAPRKTPTTRRTTTPRPAADATATTDGSTVAAASDEQENGSSRQPSLKEIVLSILEKGPAELKGLVAEVTKMIQSGEYHSKAKKVTPVVSQAVFQLKQEQLVAVEKSADNRNLYSLNQTAAV